MRGADRAEGGRDARVRVHDGCVRAWPGCISAPYQSVVPSVCHAHTIKLKPLTGFSEPRNLDEASDRIPPTSQHIR